MSSEKGPKHVYAQEHKLCYYIIITFKGIEKVKTEINDNNKNSPNNLSVKKLIGFNLYFPSMKIHNTSSKAGLQK